MSHKSYYPAFDWWKESLEDNFQILLNPLLDDLDRRITLLDLSQYLEGSLPFISEIYTDGTSITGTGTVDDPLVAAGASGDTNFANTDLTFEGSRFHEGDANNLYFHGFEKFQIYTQTSVDLQKGTDLKFWDNGDLNSITFSLKSPLPESTIYYLPPVDGTDGQVLTTNGIGDLTWEDASGGVANNLFTSDLTLAANRLHNLSTFNFNIGRATDTYHPLSLNTSNSYLGFGTSKIQVSNQVFDIIFPNNLFEFTHKGLDIFAHTTLGPLALNLHNSNNSTKVSHSAKGALSVDTDYIWGEDGNSGELLTTDGSGNLSWKEVVETVTGDSVDNTDPKNPIINAIPLSGTTVGNDVTGYVNFTTAGGVSFEDGTNSVSIDYNAATDFMRIEHTDSVTGAYARFRIFNSNVNLRVTDTITSKEYQFSNSTATSSNDVLVLSEVKPKIWCKAGIPGVTDDSNAGYVINSLLWDVTNAKMYRATSVSVGAATWLEVFNGGAAGSDSITNESTVIGTTVSDALETLHTNILNIPGRFVETTDSSSITGTTGATLIRSQLIPGGTYTTGDIIRVRSRIRKTGANGVFANSIYVNTSSSLTSASLLGSYSTTAITQLTSQIKRDFAIKSTTNTEGFWASNSIASDDIFTTQSVTSTNIDWSVDQYIIFAVNPNSAADSFIQSTYIIDPMR